jgi:quaternary ammonium compound-resistance protein SugE
MKNGSNSVRAMRAGIISQRNTFTTAGSTIAQYPWLACHIRVARTTQGEFDQSFEERRTDAGTDNTVSAWIALFGAGLLEIGWALGLKYSDGLTRFWPTVATIVAIGLSFGLMALALRSLPFGTAYAVWTGIGAAGSIIAGILLYSEPADPVRILCLTLIVAGMVGLKLNSPI